MGVVRKILPQHIQMMSYQDFKQKAYSYLIKYKSKILKMLQFSILIRRVGGEFLARLVPDVYPAATIINIGYLALLGISKNAYNERYKE